MDHLDTWARPERKITKQAPTGRRPRRCIDAGEPRSPKTTAPRTPSTRRTATRPSFDTWNHGRKKQGRPRREPPGVQEQERTTFVLLTSLGQWTGDNRGTGDRRRRRTFRLLTGAVGGGGASCRRGRRGVRGRGFQRGAGGGVRLLHNRRSPAQPSTSSKMLGSSAPKSSVSFAST